MLRHPHDKGSVAHLPPRPCQSWARASSCPRPHAPPQDRLWHLHVQLRGHTTVQHAGTPGPHTSRAVGRRAGPFSAHSAMHNLSSGCIQQFVLYTRLKNPVSPLSSNSDVLPKAALKQALDFSHQLDSSEMILGKTLFVSVWETKLPEWLFPLPLSLCLLSVLLS